MGAEVLDPTEFALRTAMDELGHLRLFYRQKRETAAIRDAGVVFPAPGDSRILAGEQAWAALERIHQSLVASTIRLVQLLSQGEWLWYLRRLIGQFEINDLATTDAYCELLAEVLTSRSHLMPPRLPDGPPTLSYSLDESRLRGLLDLRELTILTYEVHSLLRWAGKGAPIEFHADRLPDERPNSELREAVKLYDQRGTEHHASFLAGSGLAVGLPSEPFSHDSLVPVCMFLKEPVQFPLAAENPFGATHATGRFGVGAIDLAQVGTVADSALPEPLRWPSGAVDTIALLGTCYTSAFWETGILTVVPRGYRVALRRSFIRELEHTLQMLQDGWLGAFLPPALIPSSAEDVLRRLTAISGEVWPPVPASPVRVLDAGAKFMIDLYGASHLLFHLLRRPPVTGAEVNVWSRHFEEHVQRVVDASPMAPPSDVRAQVGRPLRLGGEDVTDLDAAASTNGALLLISCKGWPYTLEYDRGEYRVVRNYTSNILEALDDWDQRVSRMAAQPRGDNYDFTGFTTIVGVVALPFRPFVPLGHCLREILPGLRAVVGIGELETWLRSTRT